MTTQTEQTIKSSDRQGLQPCTIRELTALYNKDKKLLVDKQTRFYGWVRRTRLGAHDKLMFLDLYDGSSIEDLSCVISSESYQGLTFKDTLSLDELPDFSDFKTLTFAEMIKAENLSDGCAVCVDGLVVDSSTDEKVRKQKFELQVDRLRLVGGVSSHQTYPIQKSTEKSILALRQNPMYRMRSKTMQAIFKICSKADLAVALFMDEQGITKFDPNIMTISDCEGGGDTFKVSPQIFTKDPKEGQVGLTVSSQLPLEAGITGLNGVYTAQKSFRAEKSDTLKHLAEFYHIEFERAFESLPKLMDFTEKYVKFITKYVFEKCSAEFDFLESKLACPDIAPSRKFLSSLVHDDSKFIRIKHKDAITLIQKLVSDKFMLPDTDGKLKRVKLDKLPKHGEDLGSEHEKLLVKYFGWMALSDDVRKQAEKDGFFKDEIGAFVFVTHWPLAIKSFYMKQCDDGSGECESFDLLAPRVGEMFGGSMREWRAEKLSAEIAKRKMDIKPIQWFVDLRTQGSMPHGGWGMGFARYCMLITGAPTVRDVVPFPVYYTHCPY